MAAHLWRVSRAQGGHQARHPKKKAPRPCRWAVTRTFNVKGRRISIGSFLLGVIALNALNLVHREVKVWALLSRSTLAIAAGLPRPSRR